MSPLVVHIYGSSFTSKKVIMSTWPTCQFLWPSTSTSAIIPISIWAKGKYQIKFNCTHYLWDFARLLCVWYSHTSASNQTENFTEFSLTFLTQFPRWIVGFHERFSSRYEAYVGGLCGVFSDLKPKIDTMWINYQWHFVHLWSSQTAQDTPV